MLLHIILRSYLSVIIEKAKQKDCDLEDLFIFTLNSQQINYPYTMQHKAIASLQKRLKEVDYIRDKSTFQAWKDVTIDVLENIYGTESIKIKSVRRLTYNIAGQSTTGSGFWARYDYIPAGAGNIAAPARACTENTYRIH